MNPSIPKVIPVLEQAPGIRAFFTTRQGGVSEGTYASLNLGYFSGDDPGRVDRNWETLLRSQGLESMTVTRPRLCHGFRIEEITAASSLSPEDTDAVYTREENRVLAVTMGDCLPALIADPETRCIAAVHAGWRGTRDQILAKTLEHFFKKKLCRPESTHVALGPCLSTLSLEISKEIADTLPSQHVVENGAKFFFDLTGCNRSQALQAGVSDNHLTAITEDTRTNPSRFFSYRRDGAASGRMAACIALI